ncbi:MAG: hypothetical protein IID32_02010 [Planctomycetes bacterium]|nr:hypothetical protein [Planctomycetota bacterium]
MSPIEQNAQGVEDENPEQRIREGAGTEEEKSVTDPRNLDQYVPVSEAIKYRKRAQAAEQHVEKLTETLEAQEQENKRLEDHFEEVRLENELTQRLAKAGVNDLEVALLLAKQSLKSSSDQGGERQEADIRQIVNSIREERPYLFAGEESSLFSVPTAGLHRPQSRGSAAVLSKQAEKVMQSGSRQDMQEYLRLRRMAKQ